MEVKKWIVENKDFREMMTVYDKPRFLLYLDPPYLEGERLIGSVSKLMISGTSEKDRRKFWVLFAQPLIERS